MIFRNSLLFPLLKVGNSFRTNKGMMARNCSNTGNGISLGVLCICLIDCMKVWTTSGGLNRDSQRSIDRTNKRVEQSQLTGSVASEFMLRYF